MFVGYGRRRATTLVGSPGFDNLLPLNGTELPMGCREGTVQLHVRVQHGARGVVMRSSTLVQVIGSVIGLATLLTGLPDAQAKLPQARRAAPPPAAPSAAQPVAPTLSDPP